MPMTSEMELWTAIGVACFNLRQEYGLSAPTMYDVFTSLRAEDLDNAMWYVKNKERVDILMDMYCPDRDREFDDPIFFRTLLEDMGFEIE